MVRSTDLYYIETQSGNQSTLNLTPRCFPFYSVVAAVFHFRECHLSPRKKRLSYQRRDDGHATFSYDFHRVVRYTDIVYIHTGEAITSSIATTT